MAKTFRPETAILALALGAACTAGPSSGSDRRAVTDEVPAGGCDDSVRQLAGVPVRAVTGDSEFLYFVDASDQGVYRLAKAGGVPVFLGAARAGLRPEKLRLDDTYVYFMAGGDEFVRVYRVPKAGGETEDLIGYSWGGGMAIQGDFAYFSAYENSGLFRKPVAGGRSQTIYPGEDYGFGTPLATDETYLYFGGGSRTGSGAALVRMPLAGGDIDELGVVDGKWGQLVELERSGDLLISRHVASTTQGGESAIFCLPRTGGDVLTIATWDSFMGTMDVAGEGLAFAEGAADRSTSLIRVTSLTSGEPMDVVTTPFVDAIHYDDACIYMGRLDREPGLYVVAGGM